MQRRGARILRRCVPNDADGRPLVSEPGLEMLDRLHRRWAGYSAYPGRPLRFLRNLTAQRDAKQGGDHMTIGPAEVVAAFSQETGLPRFLLDESAPLDLDRTSRWFNQRVLGQPEPVRLLVDLLAAVKADVSRQGRPIASLLLIGPTGVGKTETSKALAEFLYQDPHRMVRFDMSEYGDPAAVQRLIGGADGEGLLTRQVRRQPFGVVLLDELEKAHPALFDLLLQVLGEGRLTDAAGRLADFTNSVVIMTSNLGAETYQQASLGFGETAGGGRQLLRVVREFFRPELFNRIDRVVPFQPLQQPVVRQIVDRRLEELQRRDGLFYRQTSWNISAELGDLLAEQSYQPAYGARPAARTIQRLITTPLAERLNRLAGEPAIVVTARCEDGRPVLDVRAAAPTGEAAAARTSLLAKEVVKLRRSALAAGDCTSATGLRNELYRLEQLEERLRKDPRRSQSAQRFKQLSRIKLLREIDQALTSVVDDVVVLEDELLPAFYRRGEVDAESASASCEHLREKLFRAVKRLYLMRFEQLNRLTVVLVGEDNNTLLQVAEAYYQWSSDRRGQCRAYWLVVRGASAGLAGPPAFPLRTRRTSTAEPPGFELDAYRAGLGRQPPARPPEQLIGVGLELEGELFHPLLMDEAGLHQFRYGNSEPCCLVETFESSLRDYESPPGVHAPGGVQVPSRSQNLRRCSRPSL